MSDAPEKENVKQDAAPAPEWAEQEADSTGGAGRTAINPADSATFSRCAGCIHAQDVDVSAGTLVCGKHNMIINAEADEIPDDCIEHEKKG